MKLKEFIDTYNFRNYRTDIQSGNDNDKYDTIVVRIYLSTDENKYIEFGIYDFSGNKYKKKIYEEFIDKKLLERKIASFSFDYNLNTFCVWLEE